MSVHQAFRRQPVPQQVALQAQAVTIPAPTRGIIESESLAFMQPGGAVVCDNWAPTMRGVKLRGGCVRWCDLHPGANVSDWQNLHQYRPNQKVRDAVDDTFWIVQVAHTTGAAPLTFAQLRASFPIAYVQTPDKSILNWQNGIAYNSLGERIRDVVDGSTWEVAATHTSAATGTFPADRAAHPTYWTLVTTTRQPVVSAFEYASGNEQRMFAGNATSLYDVTSSVPVLIKSGQTSGNYVAAQLANAADNYMLVCNETGDDVLRFDGVAWETLSAGYTPPAGKPTNITGPGTVAQNLTYVWKYRNRLFFIEGGTMNAWYLPLNAVGGTLSMIPLSGAASRGGRLLFGATWSVDAGDGIDDKCVFATDLGELLIFTGSNPADAANWRQEGRYAVAAPMGMNAHASVGGDLMIETVDGIVPISAAITKDTSQLEMAAITLNIKNTWRNEVNAKRAVPWSMKRWDEYGAMFVTWPGGTPGNRYCAVVNIATGAWARFVGWDATCFIRMRADLFFGTQDGIVMQADRTGYDDGQPYVATLVGGWGALGQRLQMTTWHQARASFASGNREPFQPQLAACTDYSIFLPPPPPIGLDPGVQDVWDQGKWGPDMGGPPPPVPTQPQRDRYAQWDQPSVGIPPVRNTMWVSIGATGYIHAPIVQVTVGQQAKPQVELIAIDAIHTPMGTNV